MAITEWLEMVVLEEVLEQQVAHKEPAHLVKEITVVTVTRYLGLETVGILRVEAVAPELLELTV
jgi:hypothetical protein